MTESFFLRRRVISAQRRLVKLREELVSDKAAAKWMNVIEKVGKAMEARLRDVDERAKQQSCSMRPGTPAEWER